jgi:RNA polymerase II elongation factor ELL
LSLGSSGDAASKSGSAVPEVFGLTLSDSVIEDMIKCFQNDKPLQLSLGEHPVSFTFTFAISKAVSEVWCW